MVEVVTIAGFVLILAYLVSLGIKRLEIRQSI